MINTHHIYIKYNMANLHILRRKHLHRICNAMPKERKNKEISPFLYFTVCANKFARYIEVLNSLFNKMNVYKIQAAIMITRCRVASNMMNTEFA